MLTVGVERQRGTIPSVSKALDLQVMVYKL